MGRKYLFILIVKMTNIFFESDYLADPANSSVRDILLQINIKGRNIVLLLAFEIISLARPLWGSFKFG